MRQRYPLENNPKKHKTNLRTQILLILTETCHSFALHTHISLGQPLQNSTKIIAT